MLFLFFCPASVYQQSFLGGEQTAAATTTYASTEQYRNQQRKPIRLATFEFDFKKQRSQRQENDDHGKSRVEWKDVSHREQLELIDISRKQDKQDCDENDFANGNHSEDEPIFLSFECLRNIHSLSRSMHDLIDNLNDNGISRCRLKSQSATSSLNSISESLNACNYQANSSTHCDEVAIKTMATLINHRGDGGKNENSPKEIKYLLDLNCETPKSSSKFAAANRQSKCNGKNVYDINRDDSESKFNNDDFRNSNTTVSTSSDSLTGDSSTGNDIETSDSFVNIQFARLARGQKSSSTQSMESTDSFENVSFRYAPQNNCLVDRSLQISSKLTVNQDKIKSATKILQSRTIQYSTAPNALLRSPKLDIQPDKKSSNSLKVEETDKCVKNEPVKLRHERYISRKNPIDSRNVRSKRYSCYSPCTTKRSPEEMRGGDKVTPRKFSSTDDVRDEVRISQKTTTRTKRFSLFYTPQPLRKTYEGETKTGRIACKSVNRAQKFEGKRRDEKGEEAEKEKLDKNRRSVIDASTVASRSKSNRRQNVHVRPSALVNTNRTK